MSGLDVRSWIAFQFSKFTSALVLDAAEDIVYQLFSCSYAAIMFMISWAFTIVALALAGLLYWYVSIKGKGGDWGDGFKSAYFQLALRSLRSLGGL